MAYKLKQSGDYRKRRSFSMIKNQFELDNLLQIQTESYQWFITEGIKEVLEEFSPIESFSGGLTLEFGEYEFDTPRYSLKECKDRQITYAEKNDSCLCSFAFGCRNYFTSKDRFYRY